MSDSLSALEDRSIACWIGVVIASTIVVGCAHASGPQRAGQPPASSRAPQRAPAVPVDTRGPLDRTRSAFVDDQPNGSVAAATIRTQLRAAHLWTVTDTRANADLIVTLAPAARTPTAPRARTSSYELTVRSARGTSSVPLWHGTASSPQKLVSRLKADVAPSTCIVLWCW